MAKEKDVPEAATPAAVQKAPPAPEAATPLTTGRYKVTFNDLAGEYDARDEAEAWAKFNDAHKTSYGPRVRGRKVEKVA